MYKGIYIALPNYVHASWLPFVTAWWSTQGREKKTTSNTYCDLTINQVSRRYILSQGTSKLYKHTI